MRVVVQDTLRNQQWVAYEGTAGFTVGRGEECDICLAASRFISRVHVQVDRVESGWELKVDDRAREVRIDDASLAPGERALLKPVSQLRLAEFVLTLFMDEQLRVRAAEGEDLNTLQREFHAAVLRRMDLRRANQARVEATSESLDQINSIIDDLLKGEFSSRVGESVPTRRRLMGMVYENRLVARISAVGAKQALEIERIETPGINIALEEAADEFTQRLVRRLGLTMAPETIDEDMEKVNTRLRDLLPAIIDETPDNVQFYLIARLIKKIICDMIFGLGPLQDLLDTPSVSEIMIVHPELIYIERAGRIVKSNRTFLGDEALQSVIERIVSPLGRRIDRSSPLVDARLKDGSRVNAVIPPLALKGSCMTIRRFSRRRITVEDLIRWGAANEAAFALLAACVKGYKNVVVAGGTGSGKTTMLNTLSSFIPEEDRVVTIEDAAELQLVQDHVVSLETRPPNVEGKGAYTIRDLVKNALRMRPDRIVVGECRGAETFDMLQAMNTGHSGSMTTLHSNSSQDAISRIETMCLMALDIPLAALRRQIASAVEVVVFVQRLKSGARKVSQITEVMGVHPHTGEVETRDIMALSEDPKNPVIVPTGYMPTFMGDMVDRNLIDLDSWFAGAAT